MKRWMRVLSCISLILLLTMSVAAAKPTDWVDPQYSFKGIHTAVVEPMELDGLIENEVEGRNLEQIFQSEAAKQLKLVQVQAQPATADVRIVGQIQRYDVRHRTIAAHYETRYHSERTTIRDKDGKETTITQQIPTSEYVPEQTIYTATVRLRMDVIDQKTGKEVFSRDDTRSDEYSSDRQRTYTKLVKAFYSELNRKIRKG